MAKPIAPGCEPCAIMRYKMSQYLRRVPWDRSPSVSENLKKEGETIRMAREIPIGAGAEAREVVEFRHTLASHHPDLPPVYSTPDMIRLMETAGFLALQPYCEGDEISVGTSINIEHRAASGVGANIKASAELESFDGRFYILRVSAWDDVQEIGRGSVGRAIVSIGRLLEKMKK